MNVLYLLIPVSLVLLVLAVAVFFWAVRSGQFDDLETPAYRILMDTDERRRREHDTTRTGTAANGQPSDEPDDEHR
ncbi:cbb3-type cytochrome oxidase assembly protein CcoS [Halofilum ochraceum]|uniref:cbb3-type cytochrome oxidase assembly protein CcoS n=1 Tax=Halofilum ochraceum TaxID=1611323 RepID=UPI00082EC0E2|nr:cbb3-type cytochrome oxidase assembly protein CcoS [Halofilum ochraceum]